MPLKLRDTALSLPSTRYCMSLGNRRACPRPSAIRPPCPLAKFQTLEVIGRGWSPSINTLCQPDIGGAKEEAMLELTISVGLRSEGGSWMTSGTVVRVGGVPEGTSLGHSVDLNVSRGLLHPRGAEGRGAYC